MTSILKTEKSFKNTENRGTRTLMFTVLEKKKSNDQLAILAPHDMPEVDRVQRVLTTP